MKINKDKLRGWVLAYDTKSIPKNKTFNDIEKKAKTDGLLEWDSSNEGSIPKIIHLGGDKNEWIKNLKIIDVNE